MIRFRPMAENDLPAIAAWLVLPHVARWWTADTSAEAELAEYRQRVIAEADGADQATNVPALLRPGLRIHYLT